MKKILKSLLFWIVIPVVVLAVIYQFELGVMAICFYAFFALLIVSRLMALLWLRPLHCVRELSDEVVSVGDSIKVVVKLTNPSPWPILWLYAEETLPEQMSKDGVTKRLLFLPPKRSFHLHYRLTLPRRGCHQIGPLVMESGDVFGLFKRFRVHPRRDFVTAVPPYRVIEEFQVGQRRNFGDLAAERSIFDDVTRVRGIREYRAGDPMTRIHWKCSARSGRLCSKIYDPVVDAGATVVLDFHRDTWEHARSTDPNKPPEEQAIEIASSICRYLADGGWKVGLFSNGRDPLGLPGVTIAQARATESFGNAMHAARMRRRDDRLEPIAIRARRSADQFSTIHENLGRIELSDGLPIETLLAGELPYIEREQVLVVLTARVTDSFVTGILRAREQGYRIMVFIIGSPRDHDKAFDAFLPHGIDVFDMDADWRLKEIATGRRFL